MQGSEEELVTFRLMYTLPAAPPPESSKAPVSWAAVHSAGAPAGSPVRVAVAVGWVVAAGAGEVGLGVAEGVLVAAVVAADADVDPAALGEPDVEHPTRAVMASAAVPSRATLRILPVVVMRPP
jgi:hypothetical protein